MGVSKRTVEKYCKEGMVLFAEKNRFTWDSPNEAEKPLITRNCACKLMSYIEVYQAGSQPVLKGCSFSIKQITDYYMYISNNGFISELSDGESLNERLKNVLILTPGKQLIENYNKSNLKRVNTIYNECYAEFNVGLIKVGIKHTTEN